MEFAFSQGWQQVSSFITSHGALIIVLLWLSFLLLSISLVLGQKANKKYRKQHLMLLEGIHIANVEEFILKQNDEIHLLKEEIGKLQRELKMIDQIQQLAIQRVGLVRYNPFLDIGGDQSFSLALLDGRGDGFVLTCIYGREESRIFAKPIRNDQARYRLTDEELLAIDRAKNDWSMGGLIAKGGGEDLP